MTATTSSFDAKPTPCGGEHAGECFLTEDLQGLVTEDLHYACGCRATKEEFHDGSVHRLVVQHGGKVMVDEELRGE